MSWAAILALAAGAYALKAVGPLAVGGRSLGPRTTAVLELLPVPLLAALIVLQTFTTGHRIVLDARAAGLAAAALAVAARAPFIVVVVVATAVTAAVRALA
jgi:uncharacterized membrane protein